MKTIKRCNFVFNKLQSTVAWSIHDGVNWCMLLSSVLVTVGIDSWSKLKFQARCRKAFRGTCHCQTLLLNLFRAAIITQFTAAAAEWLTRPFRVHRAQNSKWLNESRLMCNRMSHSRQIICISDTIFGCDFSITRFHIPSYLHRDLCLRKKLPRKATCASCGVWLSMMAFCFSSYFLSLLKWLVISITLFFFISPPRQLREKTWQAIMKRSFFLKNCELSETTFDWYESTPELAETSLCAVSITNMRQVTVERWKLWWWKLSSSDNCNFSFFHRTWESFFRFSARFARTNYSRSVNELT